MEKKFLSEEALKEALKEHGIRGLANSDSDSDHDIDFAEFEKYRPPPQQINEEDVIIIKPKNYWENSLEKNVRCKPKTNGQQKQTVSNNKLLLPQQNTSVSYQHYVENLDNYVQESVSMHSVHNQEMSTTNLVEKKLNRKQKRQIIKENRNLNIITVDENLNSKDVNLSCSIQNITYANHSLQNEKFRDMSNELYTSPDSNSTKKKKFRLLTEADASLNFKFSGEPVGTIPKQGKRKKKQSKNTNKSVTPNSTYINQMTGIKNLMDIVVDNPYHFPALDIPGGKKSKPPKPIIQSEKLTEPKISEYPNENRTLPDSNYSNQGNVLYDLMNTSSAKCNSTYINQMTGIKNLMDIAGYHFPALDIPEGKRSKSPKPIIQSEKRTELKISEYPKGDWTLPNENENRTLPDSNCSNQGNVLNALMNTYSVHSPTNERLHKESSDLPRDERIDLEMNQFKTFSSANLPKLADCVKNDSCNRDVEVRKDEYVFEFDIRQKMNMKNSIIGGDLNTSVAADDAQLANCEKSVSFFNQDIEGRKDELDTQQKINMQNINTYKTLEDSCDVVDKQNTVDLNLDTDQEEATLIYPVDGNLEYLTNIDITTQLNNCDVENDTLDKGDCVVTKDVNDNSSTDSEQTPVTLGRKEQNTKGEVSNENSSTNTTDDLLKYISDKFFELYDTLVGNFVYYTSEDLQNIPTTMVYQFRSSMCTGVPYKTYHNTLESGTNLYPLDYERQNLVGIHYQDDVSMNCVGKSNTEKIIHAKGLEINDGGETCIQIPFLWSNIRHLLLIYFAVYLSLSFIRWVLDNTFNILILIVLSYVID